MPTAEHNTVPVACPKCQGRVLRRECLDGTGAPLGSYSDVCMTCGYPVRTHIAEAESRPDPVGDAQRAAALARRHGGRPPGKVVGDCTLCRRSALRLYHGAIGAGVCSACYARERDRRRSDLGYVYWWELRAEARTPAERTRRCRPLATGAGARCRRPPADAA